MLQLPLCACADVCWLAGVAVNACPRTMQEPALFLRATEDLPKHEITTDTCRAAGAALEVRTVPCGPPDMAFHRVLIVSMLNAYHSYSMLRMGYL